MKRRSLRKSQLKTPLRHSWLNGFALVPMAWGHSSGIYDSANEFIILMFLTFVVGSILVDFFWDE